MGVFNEGLDGHAVSTIIQTKDFAAQLENY